jgi:hypothetical protein
MNNNPLTPDETTRLLQERSVSTMPLCWSDPNEKCTISSDQSRRGADCGLRAGCAHWEVNVEELQSEIKRLEEKCSYMERQTEFFVGIAERNLEYRAENERLQQNYVKLLNLCKGVVPHLRAVELRYSNERQDAIQAFFAALEEEGE